MPSETNVNSGVLTPISNTIKLLSNKKKLTIGYIGGSITYGRSAMATMDGIEGDIKLSYVNRVSDWFKEIYPEADITTVNAGVSDTATNFGIFRLEKTLMNENGHAMPDLVFIEFTSNDWEYDTQGKPEILIQIESIIRNIWDKNPYAEILFLSTSRYAPSISIAAYKEIGKKYGIPFIDVGTPIKNAILERIGEENESAGKFYYTVDNLHPSHIGYKLYFYTIKRHLVSLLGSEVEDKQLYNYKENLPTPLSGNLIKTPKIITVDNIEFSGKAERIDRRVGVWQHSCGLEIVSETVTDNCIDVTGIAKAKGKFTGTAFGMLFDIKSGKKPIITRYKIDDGEWKDFRIDLTTRQHQMYEHPQVFMFAHTLEEKQHTIEIDFLEGSDVFFAGMLVNEK